MQPYGYFIDDKINNNSKDSVFKELKDNKMKIDNNKAIMEEENKLTNGITSENNEINKNKNMELDREERKRKRSFKPTIPKNRKKSKVRSNVLNWIKVLNAARGSKNKTGLFWKLLPVTFIHGSQNYIKANLKARK
ncbi:unnamed protein product [Cunninghamella echinulata]